MMNFRVGEKYPLPYRPYENMTPVLDNATLSFVVVMMGMTRKKERALCNGELSFGLFAHEAIPFVICDFVGCATYDCCINIHFAPPGIRDAFLDRADHPAAMVQFHFIEGTSGILRGLRSIAAPGGFLAGIRQQCLAQLMRYATADAVLHEAALIMDRFSPRELMARAQTY